MINKACRKVGKGVIWTGLVLAALMVATGTNPNVHHSTSTGAVLGAALFVAACGGIVGGVLMLVGRRAE